MEMFADRKASFKQPPRHVLDKSVSQEYRRNKALEEQKRRRAQRVESERHIDLFADLSLGLSDEEADNQDGPDIVRDGVGQLASLLQKEHPNGARIPTPDAQDEPSMDVASPTPSSRRKGKRKKATKASNKKPSPWANNCMYAELLEMQESESWSGEGDGLPSDLESAWVAIAPVPLGKRCLAIAHQGSGTVGLVPNTTIRSRVLGKPLMPRFPSFFPSDTILDCILDQNWRDNGILHILDVIKWKGQDIADCESSFRFWWRDTRLAELPPSNPPTTSAPPPGPQASTQGAGESTEYRFPYPTTFLAVPYHTDTTFTHLINRIIPLARSSYSVPVSVPTGSDDVDGMMEVETLQPANPVSRISQAEVKSDGLLLYVAQAIYEPGISPLSTWVPLVALTSDDTPGPGSPAPLDVFERLIRRRIARGAQGVSMLH
ncbi:hypothetical protein BC834DRAFT_881723 [Gloeopeniophorella convolvens]|nr:hypothetical protein BC834DRAFT_881723 [Gloeopeniophorella convolvens]